MSKLLLVPLVIASCGWSWATYFFGRPLDKERYWSHAWGWLSPEMDHAWADWKVRDKGVFHELKNLGAEWARAWPQTAAKVLSLFILLALLLGLVAGFIAGLAL